MKWKIRLARDMAQEAFLVIEAPTSEEAEAILWHDMNRDVIRWSDDDVWATVRSGRSTRLRRGRGHPARSAAGSTAQSTENLSRHLAHRGRGGHAAQRGETSPVLANAAGHGDLRGLRGLPESRWALRTSSHDRLTPDADRALPYAMRRA
jgi:hypothetical protein